MLHIIGKMLKKLVARKLVSFGGVASSSPTLDKYQLNREACENAAIFSHDVFMVFQWQSGTCVASIDLEDAYSMVHLDFLARYLDKMCFLI